ncbi:MAG: hypothetical protein DHS20C11_21990 [Lysobacteraceae bacterium]|nr:MAG: hypothetical protein DHS20C11_21990 [Xanthomonadaceae bacterium]
MLNDTSLITILRHSGLDPESMGCLANTHKGHAGREVREEGKKEEGRREKGEGRREKGRIDRVEMQIPRGGVHGTQFETVLNDTSQITILRHSGLDPESMDARIARVQERVNRRDKEAMRQPVLPRYRAYSLWRFALLDSGSSPE